MTSVIFPASHVINLQRSKYILFEEIRVFASGFSLHLANFSNVSIALIFSVLRCTALLTPFYLFSWLYFYARYSIILIHLKRSFSFITQLISRIIDHLIMRIS